MKLVKCKICGKEPNYTRVEPDSGGMHSGHVVISCCSTIYLDPGDINLGYSLVGMSGWDIIYAKLNECEREAKKRWNTLNATEPNGKETQKISIP